MKIRKMLKRIGLAVTTLVVVTSLVPMDAFAAAARGDIYDALHDAMIINVVGGLMKKCIGTDGDYSSSQVRAQVGDSFTFEEYTINGSEAAAGDIFNKPVGRDIASSIFGASGAKTESVPLWLENVLGEDDELDGALYCGEGNLLGYFVGLLKGSDKNILLCGENNNGGILTRAKKEEKEGALGQQWVAENGNCNYFSDTDVYYARTQDAQRKFRNFYNDWRSSHYQTNPYLPYYDDLGNLTNMDKYFSLLEDFNAACKSTGIAGAGTYDSDPSYVEYYEEGGAIAAKPTKIHIDAAKDTGWDEYDYYSNLTPGKCSDFLGQDGAINKMASMQYVSNGITHDNRLIAALNNACKGAIYSHSKEELLAMYNDEEIEALKKADETGLWYKKSGNQFSEGATYQCVADVEVESYDAIDIGSGGSEGLCFDNSGALGWIVCPVIEGVSAIGESAYGFIEENFLQVRAGLFSDDNMVTVWGYFRDIANVAFVVLFMVVIFSQLTGVGIDNYGIKKIMPKLIVTAVLVNLSYLICELATDLSNIIGNGLENMLSSAASQVSIGTMSGNIGSGLVATFLAGGGTFLFTLLSVGSLGLVPVALGLAVLGAALTAVISIVFLFLILIVRNAGIVILIAVAPVAFVCYMLPNTEKTFKKWVDLFKALLIVYPICGLLIGGGKLAGRLVASIGGSDGVGEIMAVAGMIIEVLPFFLIPMLLKNSLSLLGNVGAQLSSIGRGWGQKASSGVTGVIKNSDKYKNFAQDKQEQDAIRRAQKIHDKYSGKDNLTPYQKRRLHVAQSRLVAKREADNRVESMINGGYEDALVAAEDKAWNDGIEQSVAGMRRNGIKMNDDTYKMFDKQGIEDRLGELASKDTLDDKDKKEVAALMHAASSVAGGTSAMGNVIRGKKGEVNKAFMEAAGAAYLRDSSVRTKLTGDVGASMYVEQFTPGGEGGKYNDFDDFKNNRKAATDSSLNYKDQIKKRTKSYEVGLNQSGDAFEEYLHTLNGADCQRIIADDKLLGSIDPGDRQKFLDYAKEEWHVDDKFSSEGAVVTPGGHNPKTGTTGPSRPKHANAEWNQRE